MTYTLTSSAYIVRDSDSAIIPDDPMNMDWQIYQAWLAAGNTPNPVPTPVSVVPPQVSRRQFFQAAAQQAIISETDAEALFAGAIPASLATAVSQLPAGQQFAARMAILGDQFFYRADTFVVALGPLMGMTPAQLDAFFILAASL